MRTTTSMMNLHITDKAYSKNMLYFACADLTGEVDIAATLGHENLLPGANFIPEKENTGKRLRNLS